MAYVYTTTNPDARSRPLYRATQAVWYVAYLLEVILAFRFILKLLGANSGATFTSLIYGLSAPFTAPFRAVFGSANVAGSTLEWTTLLAMFVYWLLAWAIVRLFVMSKPVSTIEADAKLRNQDIVE